jgi:hypothetical protein
MASKGGGLGCLSLPDLGEELGRRKEHSPGQVLNRTSKQTVKILLLVIRLTPASERTKASWDCDMGRFDQLVTVDPSSVEHGFQLLVAGMDLT